MDWEKLVSTVMKNWEVKPSKPDNRDWPLGNIIEPPEVLPDAVTLLPYIYHVKNQGTNPYCAGSSLNAAAEAFFNMRGILPPGGFSDAWTYWQAKEIDELPPGQGGTTLRAVLQVGQKIGFCPEYLCPTLPGNTKPKFTDAMFKAAEKYKLESYARVEVGTLENIQKAIAAGYLVLIGSIVTRTNWADGWILQPEGFFAGGHATVQGAYDRLMMHIENDQLFENFNVGLNSWGEEWGFGGYYRMCEHYAQFKFVDLGGMPALMEAWAIKFAEPFKPQAPDAVREFLVEPILFNDRVMVELRSLVNIAGAKAIQWDSKAKKATVRYDDKVITLQVGKKEYKIEAL